MKIFVVSWFYPPVTTSEALVTYKLLSNSRHDYYLCSASSKKWSYTKESDLKSKNVNQYIIETEDFDEFIEKTYAKYIELSKKIKFDAIMTRSMPPESQKVGLMIKQINPDIPWIVSLADPIGNNPYETTPLILSNRIKFIKNMYLNVPHFFLNHICKYARSQYTKKLSYLHKFEQDVVNKSDIVIVPTVEQGKFIMYKDEIYNQKCLVVPHSFDKKLYPNKKDKDNDKFVFSFIGHSDYLRSVEPVVRAIKVIKDYNPEFLNKIKVRLVGNIPNNIKNMVYVFFLQDVISIEGSVDYQESLNIMQNSDCLIHVDAYFDVLDNGSIFFAAKIADYLGAGKPILGITSPLCPAGKIITETGGVCSDKDPYKLAKTFMDIVNNPISLNDNYKKYDVINVARDYDDEIERRIKNGN